MLKSLVLFTFLSEIRLLTSELWEKDMSSAMEIGLSTTGYHSVDLRCDAEHFEVNVTLDTDFEGVVYTRGSYHDKKVPCFKRHDRNVVRENGKLKIGMRIPFDKCQTVMDVAESCYANTIVIQHDPELIMPGDAAFSLQCSFVPEFKVSSDMSAGSSSSPPSSTPPPLPKPSSKPPYKSRITLVNADPADKTKGSNQQNLTIFSDTDHVSFRPRFVIADTETKDEL